MPPRIKSSSAVTSTETEYHSTEFSARPASKHFESSVTATEKLNLSPNNHRIPNSPRNPSNPNKPRSPRSCFCRPSPATLRIGKGVITAPPGIFQMIL